MSPRRNHEAVVSPVEWWGREKSDLAWTMDDQWYFPPLDFIGMLEDHDQEALLKIARQQHFDKGIHIFEAGDRSNRVYIVKSGRAKVYQISPSGKKVILWFCFPGEMFGLAELSRSAKRAIFAQASVETEILAIEQRDFLTFMAARPNVALKAIEVISIRLRRLGRSLMNLATVDVAVRLARLVLGLAQSYGRHHCKGDLVSPEMCIDIRITHQEIADLISASRQTVTTLLNDFKRKGALHWESHHIHIDRPDILEQILLDHEA